MKFLADPDLRALDFSYESTQYVKVQFSNKPGNQQARGQSRVRDIKVEGIGRSGRRAQESCSVGILPALQRAGRPRYVEGISASTFMLHTIPKG
jgi:hypothetical protein